LRLAPVVWVVVFRSSTDEDCKVFYTMNIQVKHGADTVSQHMGRVDEADGEC
jgi:hypothetical protein